MLLRSTTTCYSAGLWARAKMVRLGLRPPSPLPRLQVKRGGVTRVLVVCWTNRLWGAFWRCWWVVPRLNMLLSHEYFSVVGSLLQDWRPLDFTCNKQLSWSGLSPGYGICRQLEWSLYVSLSEFWRLDNIIYGFIRSQGSTCMRWKTTALNKFFSGWDKQIAFMLELVDQSPSLNAVPLVWRVKLFLVL